MPLPQPNHGIKTQIKKKEGNEIGKVRKQATQKINGNIVNNCATPCSSNSAKPSSDLPISSGNKRIKTEFSQRIKKEETKYVRPSSSAGLLINDVHEYDPRFSPKVEDFLILEDFYPSVEKVSSMQDYFCQLMDDFSSDWWTSSFAYYRLLQPLMQHAGLFYNTRFLIKTLIFIRVVNYLAGHIMS